MNERSPGAFTAKYAGVTSARADMANRAMVTQIGVHPDRVTPPSPSMALAIDAEPRTPEKKTPTTIQKTRPSTGICQVRDHTGADVLSRRTPTATEPATTQSSARTINRVPHPDARFHAIRFACDGESSRNDEPDTEIPPKWASPMTQMTAFGRSIGISMSMGTVETIPLESSATTATKMSTSATTPKTTNHSLCPPHSSRRGWRNTVGTHWVPATRWRPTKSAPATTTSRIRNVRAACEWK